MTELLVAFVLGAIAWWAFTRLTIAIAFGSRRVGSDVRRKWLGKLDYEALLRTKKQIDDEIARRQP